MQIYRILTSMIYEINKFFDLRLFFKLRKVKYANDQK